MSYRFLDTKDCLLVVVGGKPYTISAASPIHIEVRAAVIRDEPEESVLAIINRKSDLAQKAVNDLSRRQSLGNRLTYSHGVIYLDGRALHNYAARRLAEFVEKGYDCTSLAAFILKQEANPSTEVIEHLYSFLEYGKIPLTPDGDFLVYKAVRPDYKDIHSGTFLNEVGATPTVPRETVDPDRSRTCSHGLHVCSFAYLPSFAHADGHVMLCKVNPTDVVAIPNDYNNTKMRVCRYEVVGEVTSYYQRREDVLGEGPLLRSKEYLVMYRDPTHDTDEVYESFYTEEEAQMQCQSLEEQNPEIEVWVDTPKQPGN